MRSDRLRALGASASLAGYYVTVQAGAGAQAGPTDCHGGPTRTAYYASARPLNFGSGGTRAFAVTAQGQVWQVDAPHPPTEPFRPPAQPVQ